MNIFCDTSVLLAAAKSSAGASRALVFPVAKDRPVLVTALAWADVLLTLDRADFIGLLGSACYGMPILLPSEFFIRERAADRI